MSQRVRVPFATTCYQSRSKPLSVQRIVNLYAEIQPEDAKSKLALFGTPGLRRFVTLPTGPVRGLCEMGEQLYAVAGGTLYRISSAGRVEALGSVTASGDVLFMQTNGRQIAIVGGGSMDVWDGTTVAKVTADGLPSVVALAFLDGYGIWVESQSEHFGITDLRDFKTVDALDYASAESSPDKLVTVIVDHREAWLFGRETIEVWTNTGNADFPLERIGGAIIERGTAARHSVARLDNTVFWLGDDKVIYRAAQYQPQRISQHAIEYAIEHYDRVDDAVALAYTQGGHAFYALTFPSAPGGGVTWVYDASTGLWHERMSGLSGRWRAQCVERVYGKLIVGDATTGDLWELALDVRDEGGEPIRWSATSPPMHAEGQRAQAHRLELEFETGVGLTAGQGSDPAVMLRWSDDGGRTWSSEHWRSLGKIGEYRHRPFWTRLGAFRSRVWEVSGTDPVPATLISAIADIDGLSS